MTAFLTRQPTVLGGPLSERGTHVLSRFWKMYPLQFLCFSSRENIEKPQTYLYRSHMMPSYLKEVLDFLVLWLKKQWVTSVS